MNYMEKFEKLGVKIPNILLPKAGTDYSKYAVLACDQYAAQPEYWEKVKEYVGSAPSTLNMTLPEAFLLAGDKDYSKRAECMEEYLSDGTIEEIGDGFIFTVRDTPDGTRYGLVAAFDLEQYDYNPGSDKLIKVTEMTDITRVAPRVEIRKQAVLELPHVLMLVVDKEDKLMSMLKKECRDMPKIYDFDLMEGGGHVKGFLLRNDEQDNIAKSLEALITEEAIGERYGDSSLAPLLFAVGDGNHSLATAKAAYEEVKACIGVEAAKNHPARYALAEVVNLHDASINFEPIYRVVFNCNPTALLSDLKAYLASLDGTAKPQAIHYVSAGAEGDLTVNTPVCQLAVGTLQTFLGDYAKAHPEVEVDYIHGEDSLCELAKKKNAIGFLFEGMRKDELFRTVIYDGALPRKTFSMGHARDKRYYLECRKIK